MSGGKNFFNGEIQELSLGLVGNTDVNAAGVGGKLSAKAVCPIPLPRTGKNTVLSTANFKSFN